MVNYIDEDLDYIYVRVGKENKSVREMSWGEFRDWIFSRIKAVAEQPSSKIPAKEMKFTAFVDAIKLKMLQLVYDLFGYQPVMIKRDKRKEWR